MKMNYELIPIIAGYDVLNATQEETGRLKNRTEIASLLFPENFMNDCYKRFYFGDHQYIETEEDEDIKAVMITLKKNFPNYDCCLIDVSW